MNLPRLSVCRSLNSVFKKKYKLCAVDFTIVFTKKQKNNIKKLQCGKLSAPALCVWILIARALLFQWSDHLAFAILFQLAETM